MTLWQEVKCTLQHQQLFCSAPSFLLSTSSVARGGGGGSSSPNWLVKYAKSHVFCAFEADFLWKMENSPPHTKRAPPQTFELAKLEEKSPWILAKTFFFGDHLILGGKNLWILDFGRKIALNFGEDLFFYLFFFFFGDHLILGGKNLWILDFGRKITLNFGEDLFFFFFWRSPNFGRKKPLNFRDISSQISDKPSETDSRSMKIRVKVVCTLLTVSK